MPHTLTISQLTGQLAQGELTSREAIQACLDRIAAVDGQLNAFLSHDPEDALAQADDADAVRDSGVSGKTKPLLGVPIAMKDVIAVNGHPLNCASKILGVSPP